MKKRAKFRCEAETAEVLIYDEIGRTWDGEGISAKDFVTDLRALDGVTDLVVRINSPGGDVFDGMAIYEALRAWKGRVSVKIDSLAASAASVIAMAGDTVEIAENGFMMIHRGSGLVWGNAKDMAKMADTLTKIDGQIATAYQRKAEGTLKEWLAAMDEETWYNAEESVAIGLADTVSEQVKVAAAWDWRRFWNSVPEQFVQVFDGAAKQRETVAARLRVVDDRERSAILTNG